MARGRSQWEEEAGPRGRDVGGALDSTPGSCLGQHADLGACQLMVVAVVQIGGQNRRCGRVRGGDPAFGNFERPKIFGRVDPGWISTIVERQGYVVSGGMPRYMRQLWWVIILCALLYRLWTAPSPARLESMLNERLGSNYDRTALILTAHPDDEAMFFSPTILHLRQNDWVVRGLCLSTGQWAL